MDADGGKVDRRPAGPPGIRDHEPLCSSSSDPGHAELLCHTLAVLDHDVRSEEDELLPLLQARLGRRELQALGLAWEIVRRVSPTRPHPTVSRRPPGQTLSALPLTVLDRARDQLQRLDETTSHRFGPRLDAADRALAALAGAVERRPVMRRGERRERHR